MSHRLNPATRDMNARQMRKVFWEEAYKHDDPTHMARLFRSEADVRNATWWLYNPRNDQRPRGERTKRHTGTRHVIDELCIVRNDTSAFNCLTWLFQTFPKAFTADEIQYACRHRVDRGLQHAQQHNLETKVQQYTNIRNCVQAHLQWLDTQESDERAEPPCLSIPRVTTTYI